MFEEKEALLFNKYDEEKCELYERINELEATC